MTKSFQHKNIVSSGIWTEIVIRLFPFWTELEFVNLVKAKSDYEYEFMGPVASQR